MIVYWLLVSLGLMYILRYGSIVQSPRAWLVSKHHKLQELFNCSLCLGFWTGVACMPGVILYTGLLGALGFPFASAAWCWSIDTLHDVVVSWKHKP